MSRKRIITCLDVRDGRLTKGVKFLHNADIGDPVEAAKNYDAQGVDELVFYDITATHEKRGTMMDVAAKVAEAVTVPFAIGGGIRSLDDFRQAIAAGAGKVHMNSAAVTSPELIEEAAREFGSARVVLSMDVLAVGDKTPSGVEVVINGGRTHTGMDAVEWAKRGERLGAGEIVVNSIDADGTREGFDIRATRAIADAVNIPVVASGGGGTVEHIYKALTDGGADGALVSSMLHYGTHTVAGIREELEKLYRM